GRGGRARRLRHEQGGDGQGEPGAASGHDNLRGSGPVHLSGTGRRRQAGPPPSPYPLPPRRGEGRVRGPGIIETTASPLPRPTRAGGVRGEFPPPTRRKLILTEKAANPGQRDKIGPPGSLGGRTPAPGPQETPPRL